MNTLVELLIPLAGIAMVFGIVYVSVTASHREKMAKIAAGMDPNENLGKWSNDKKIRLALLLILVPLGIFTGNVLADSFDMFRAKTLGLLGGFLFGGLAFLISFLLGNKIEQKEREMAKDEWKKLGE